MDKQTKIFLSVLFASIVVSGGLYIYLSAPYDKNFQILSGSEIANVVNGSFTKLSEVHPSGTAIDVPFNEYLKNFESRPKKAIVGESSNEDLKIFYLTKVGDITYVSSETYKLTLHRYVSGEMTGPNEVKLHFESSVKLGVFYWMLAIIVSFLLAVVATPSKPK